MNQLLIRISAQRIVVCHPTVVNRLWGWLVMHLRCAPQGGRAGPEVIQIRAPDIQIFSEALSQSIVNQLLMRLSGMAMSIAIWAQVLASGAGSRVTAELTRAMAVIQS